ALLGGDDVLIQRAQTGREALTLLEEGVFDAIVLGLDLANLPAFELIDQIEHTKAGAGTPIIVYAPHELEAAYEARLSHLAQSLVLRHVRSMERLLDDVALFLHRD